ncbi:hypothetical protein [Kitasatospora sp. MAP5-34]|uniref:hypothetical protein n=1 Tax=Kitasatospora sp. MAP5-34 TaxID=3035102 RepID=UPI00247717A0|nr:hypothetical protein [Kitasatospora sp. MAP5-34]MDH6575418.1 sugar/nucleoside kinase (ribokinase family) [Kitasatospora sp. MAP5-34]
MVQRDGENAITLSPGANGHLDVATLERITACGPAGDGRTDGGLVGPADTLLLQLEVPLPTVPAAARAGREAGALVVLNAARLPEAAESGGPVLRWVDVLVVNETEAVGLLEPSGRPWTGRRIGRRTGTGSRTRSSSADSAPRRS